MSKKSNQTQEAPVNFFTALQCMEVVNMHLQKKLSATERSVWFALLEYCQFESFDKKFFADNRAIASKAAVSLDSFTRAIKRLNEVGLVEYCPGNGRHNSSSFKIQHDIRLVVTMVLDQYCQEEIEESFSFRNKKEA